MRLASASGCGCGYGCACNWMLLLLLWWLRCKMRRHLPPAGALMLAAYDAAPAHGLCCRSTPTALQVDTGVCDSASVAVSVCRWTV